MITGILSATLHNSSFPSSRKLDTQAEEPRRRKEGRGEGRSLAQDWKGGGLRGPGPPRKCVQSLQVGLLKHHLTDTAENGGGVYM